MVLLGIIFMLMPNLTFIANAITPDDLIVNVIKSKIDEDDPKANYEDMSWTQSIAIKGSTKFMPPRYDILLMIDASASIADNPTKLEASKLKAMELVELLLNNPLLDVTIGVIKFHNTAIVASDFTNDATAVNDVILDIMPSNNKGTNLAAALNTAVDLEQELDRDGVPKYIILFSDGLITLSQTALYRPPYFINNDGEVSQLIQDEIYGDTIEDKQRENITIYPTLEDAQSNISNSAYDNNIHKQLTLDAAIRAQDSGYGIISVGNRLSRSSRGYKLLNTIASDTDALPSGIKGYYSGSISSLKSIFNSIEGYDLPAGSDGQIIDTVPSYLTIDESSITVNGSRVSALVVRVVENEITWQVGTLDDTQNILTYKVRLNGSYNGFSNDDGSINLNGSENWLVYLNENENSAAIKLGVPTGIIPTRGLQLTKIVDKDMASAGDRVKYTYTVKNTGDTYIDDIIITDDVFDAPFTVKNTHLAPGKETVIAKYHTISKDAAFPYISSAYATGWWLFDSDYNVYFGNKQYKVQCRG